METGSSNAFTEYLVSNRFCIRKTYSIAQVKDDYRELNRALSSLLVAVRAPGIVSTLTGLLSTQTSGETNLAPNEADLERIAKRNAGYGRAVRVLNNRTDLLQIHYARPPNGNEKELWTVADRKAYFTWLNRAQTWTGGNSYRSSWLTSRLKA